MALAVVYSRAQSGVNAPLVTVEVHIANGLPAFSIVGLPETTVRESKDRVRGALQTSHFEFPAQRITVNLGPADLPKEGSRFDLAIAVGVLAASGQVPQKMLSDLEFVGELALSGQIRPVSGILPTILQARGTQRQVIIAAGNASEASLAPNTQLLAADHLTAVCSFLRGTQPLTPIEPTAAGTQRSAANLPDLADVQGQHRAKRALEIAAAGAHNLILIGPPGTGKTMLASRLPSILPTMSDEEALETAALASISSQGFDPRVWRVRPFRAPHHTASAVALVGGGGSPRPGEVSLAHNGVLFLDELPEFARHVLEVLREPLENGRIVISRAARQAEFPARFQLIAAMNPCPCGFAGDPSGRCRCAPDQIERYRGRLSGPLLDRIDLHIEVSRPSHWFNRAALTSAPAETSATIRARVERARQVQIARSGKPNAQLAASDLAHACALSATNANLLEKAVDRMALSPRSAQRIIKVARTIADLAGATDIATAHLTEALSYRQARI